MGMPCEVNSMLKLSVSQGYPEELRPDICYEAVKDGYRIIPIDVPIPLVDAAWIAHADVVIHKLTWEAHTTVIHFTLHRCYPAAFSVKGTP